MRKGMSTMVVAALATGLSLGFGPAVSAAEKQAPPAKSDQIRGYWVDAFNPGIFSAKEVGAMIAAAREARANVLFVQTVRRFDCFCNKGHHPRTDAAIAPAPFDPLAEIVKQAHAAGLQVHAWVNATTLWNSTKAPRDTKHAYHKHGPNAQGRDRWLNKRVDGKEIVDNNSYVDPAHPDVVEDIVAGAVALQKQYGIDGINLDYIRYPDNNSTESANDWGYTDTALARFKAHTGRADRPAPADEQWSAWRRGQVDNIVRRVYAALYTHNPKTRLSVNGITYGVGSDQVGSFEKTRPYGSVLQDYRAWMRDGYIDTVAAMNYKRESRPEQAQGFRSWNKTLQKLAADSGRHVISGAALHLNTIPESLTQAKEIAGHGLGWGGYSYASPSSAGGDAAKRASERKTLHEALVKEVFTAPAAVPEMPWKQSTGLISGKAIHGGKAVDQATVTLTPLGGAAGGQKTVLTDASGQFVFAGLAPGQYKAEAKVSGQGKPSAPVTVQVAAGKTAGAELTAP
ncbi:family 10 glycosylhydrolase [Austwickia chelonae]|uniref:family 10 glycosylhydrolase n=1 Tax=Austwickia chelonae TaxID=100225 RepID=UPI000E224E7E|nr:family 10 glycosylhydrolase [Austwickia chelonae]